MNTYVQFGTSVAGDQRILTVSGEVDMTVSALFERELLAALSATPVGGELVVDLSEVRFFDVKALRALLRGADAAHRAGVPLRLTASSAVGLVFDALGIDAEYVPPNVTRTSTDSWMDVQ